MVLGCLMCLETNQKAGASLLCHHYSINICYIPSGQVHGQGRTQSCCPQDVEGTSWICAEGSQVPMGCGQILTRTSLFKVPLLAMVAGTCPPPACSQVSYSLVQPSPAPTPHLIFPSLLPFLPLFIQKHLLNTYCFGETAMGELMGSLFPWNEHSLWSDI